MRILVTGASGYLGRHSVANLLRRGLNPSDLILVTRNPAALSAMAQRGADVRAGDFSHPEGLAAAFSGADRMLLIAAAPDNLPPGLDQVTAHKAAIAAAAAAATPLVVFQSSLAAAADAVPRDEDDYQTEQALRASGMGWTMLRTAAFADSRGREAKAYVRQGEIITNAADAVFHTVSRADIAEAAAAVLMMPDPAGRVFNLVSPGVTMDQLGAALAELAGRPIRVRHVGDEAYRAALVAAGRRPGSADRQVMAGRMMREHPQSPSSDLPALIGREGQTLIDLLRANRDELLTGDAPRGGEPMFL